MLEGVRSRLGADVGAAITGIAGPGGGSPEKPVGLVYVGVAGPGGVSAQEHRLRGDRERIRERSTAIALHALRLELEGRRGV
jgi:nicotinamide-nucleotide amidase